MMSRRGLPRIRTGAMHILVVDDHPLYREGLKALLWGLSENVEVTGASSLDEALPMLRGGVSFDLVLLDMNLPGRSHLEALAAVKAEADGAPVVVVSGDIEPVLIMKTIEAGAAGYIPKTTDQAVTINALRLVLAHGVYLPPEALRASGSMEAPAGQQPLLNVDALSGRQRAVLKRLLQGKANKVIARELSIAEGTVKAHLWSAYQVLGVSSRMQAMCRVHELGLMDALGD